MAKSTNFHCCILVLLAIGLNNIPTSTCLDHDHFRFKHIVPLFIFGDSLFDAGNNNYINTTTGFQANFRPYGESFFKYPTGRFSDGRLIPDFIAEYAKLPLIPPYNQPGIDHEFAYGVNFASAGAGALTETYPGLVVNLKTQLSNFKDVGEQLMQKLGNKEAKKLISNAVFLFSVGAGDYVSTWISNSSSFQSAYARQVYVDRVISNFTAVINEIYKKGGRKFGFVNMGPLGCSPVLKLLGNTTDCVQDLRTVSQQHNRALSLVLQKLEKELKGFKYSNFDFFTTVSDRLDHPLKYGFKDGKSACCGSGPYRGIDSCGGKRGTEEYELCDNPSEYLFFDNDHLSETANQQLAELFWTGTSDIVWPCNLKALFD